MELISRKEALSKGLKKFFTGKKCKNGHISEQYTKSWKCVQCEKERAKKYREDNLEKLRAYDVEYGKKNKDKKAKYYQEHREKRIKKNAENREAKKEYNKIYNEKNKDKILAQKKEYHIKNREKRLKYNNERYIKNREKIIKQVSEYSLKNKDKIKKRFKEYKKINREKINKYYREKYNTPHGKLISFTRGSLRRMIIQIKEKKEIRSIIAINYTIEDLKKHIESQFDIMMTWENHGLWHIDHIIPLSYLVNKHKGKSQEEIINIVNSLDNLRPLWAYDNLSKGAKII